jgi:hypothetical protein
MKILILICLVVFTQQREPDRFILNLKNIDNLPFLKIEVGDSKIEKNVLISTSSKQSYMKNHADFFKTVKYTNKGSHRWN